MRRSHSRRPSLRGFSLTLIGPSLFFYEQEARKGGRWIPNPQWNFCLKIFGPWRKKIWQFFFNVPCCSWETFRKSPEVSGQSEVVKWPKSIFPILLLTILDFCLPSSIFIHFNFLQILQKFETRVLLGTTFSGHVYFFRKSFLAQFFALFTKLPFCFNV